jgi:hypothetical protein
MSSSSAEEQRAQLQVLLDEEFMEAGATWCVSTCLTRVCEVCLPTALASVGVSVWETDSWQRPPARAGFAPCPELDDPDWHLVPCHNQKNVDMVLVGAVGTAVFWMEVQVRLLVGVFSVVL